MLNDAGLSQDYWVEAVDTTCYLVNRSSTSTLVDNTPYEAWDGKKHSLAHLRVFVCYSFMHISKERRQKLDSKLEKCIFIGYKDGVKGYKLWNPATRTTVYSRDVILREDERVLLGMKRSKIKETKNLEFNLRNETHDSDGSIESQEEV